MNESYQQYKVLALGFHPPTAETLSAFQDMETYKALVKDETAESLNNAYYGLFSFSVAGGIPPYETEYLRKDTFKKADILADIGGFYQAFGLEVSNMHDQRMDFIASELEFMFWLGLKEGWAKTNHKADEEDRCKTAMQKFLQDHLITWAVSFAKQVAEHADIPFYRKLGDELSHFLQHECERLGVSPVEPPYYGKSEAKSADSACQGCES